MIYTLGFVLSLFALMGIMLDRQGLKKLSYLLLPALGLWGFGVAGQTHSLSSFFALSFVDLLFMGGAALVFRGLSHSRQFTIPAALVALLSMTAVHTLFERKIDEKTDINTSFNELNLDEHGELLVELQNDYDLERWKKWIGAQNWETSLAFQMKDGSTTDLDDYYLVDIPAEEGTNLAAVIEKIKASGFIDWIEPNEQIQVSLEPARKLAPINKTLGVNDPQLDQQWAMEALKMDAFYKLLEKNGKQAVKKQALVAILDTGVDAKHEDLHANYVSIDKKSDDDPRGHGTHCAGIAGAVTNNGIGVASFARSADYYNITSVKVLKAGGSGTQKDIIQGIITAVDNGADVLSLSLGGFSTQSRQRAYSEAVKYATEKGAIVVAAAGNSNKDAANYTPVNARGMIGVSAIDNELNRASFSNRVGRIDMALAAPGVAIFSTKPNNNYEAHNGTSMATPFVSGLLGVMKSIRPELTNKQAYKILYDTGIKTKDTANTSRLIQPAAALERLLKEKNS